MNRNSVAEKVEKNQESNRQGNRERKLQMRRNSVLEVEERDEEGQKVSMVRMCIFVSISYVSLAFLHSHRHLFIFFPALPKPSIHFFSIFFYSSTVLLHSDLCFLSISVSLYLPFP